MGTMILYALLGCNAVFSMLRPWFGVVLGFLFAILTPHNIWWWAFQDVRPVMWVLLPTLVGFGLAVLARKNDYSAFGTRLNRYMLALMATTAISYYLGPYVDVVNDFRFYDPSYMFSSAQKTFIAYFLAVILIDNERKLKWLGSVLVITTIYMTYWANAQYFLHHSFGRLSGPVPLGGYSIYQDENVFAVLFVAGAPFVWYAAHYLKSKSAYWLALFVILFSWHAIFLTASRGALLAIAVTVLAFAFRQKKKALGILTILAFTTAFAWQAGDLMKSRSATITAGSEEESASGRLDAWKAATKMMISHPLTGVGFASFGQAFPNYSEAAPRIAHNSFFQLAGEQGVIAALAFALLTLSTINRLRKNGRHLLELKQTEQTHFYYCMNEASYLGFLGFSVCAVFLSLANYDIMYCLLIISNKILLDSERMPTLTAQPPSDSAKHPI